MPEFDRYTCEEVFRRLDDYVDRELSPRELSLVEEHLKVCEWCASEARFERSVVDQVRSKLCRIAAPSGLLDRIRATLAAEEQSGGAGAVGSA